ncbi:uncharacterized protein MONOS_7828 [Monocercomonoides exilis]|uniref:uncharacterized protein n=1 Tax=Monocercomonoides exilis TaxID=2049356 RepID=UPI00355A57E5|nr:hypothetical protein MONOS_7828 [Monocercomonoides exilis]|eukprot:MONOS_7828.1-p1 / transcript=MONOS_7828.1 / gene=MONOS_7828 / organism=Monocercomonoides_exilis_PA203 / gene_product=unspecified product / transcript_product=unspecified product / location=Mono_scaffold00278:28866-31331(-) / protein_length=822 / sequence_SO=supercontig / SO=protein_coding / is_pseudo=false
MFFGLILFQIIINICANEEPSKASTVFVKQSGDESYSGLEIGKEKQSLNDAYNLLRNDSACNIKIVHDTDPLTAEAVIFNKEHGITIEGWKSDGSGNTEVSIDCDVHPGCDLFVCKETVQFCYLEFHFHERLNFENENPCRYSLIYGEGASLLIRNCRFIRSETGESDVFIYLVQASGGSLTMESVECADEANFLTLKNELFYIYNDSAVTLSNISLKKVEANWLSIIYISDNSENSCDIILNGSSFSECKGESYGALRVEFYNGETTFTVGDGGITTFSSCSCSYNQGSGGIFLAISAIESASQLRWPEDGRNLLFDRCTAGEGESKRNIGLHLEMANDSLFKDIADAMRKSFANCYNRRDNLWNVVGREFLNGNECDFVSKYFDPPPPKPENMTKAFVKNGGKGNGINIESACYSLKDAYDYLKKGEKCFIDIINDADLIKAEAISLNVGNGITIEGMNSDGNGNVEVAIDCDVSASSALFMCEKEVEFKYLAFNIPTSERKWDYLIFGNEMSTSLTISNIRFARVGRQSPKGGIASNDHEDDFAVGSLVSVLGGKVSVKTVTCTDEKNTVSFLSSPFSFSGASEVSLNGVEIGKVKVKGGAAISINDGIETTSKVSIEGLDIKDSTSENGASAGLEISLSSEESKVEIGRTSKCTFKSCTAPKGKAGAMSIKMPKAASNLHLPSANNLEIDGSNTANSTARSICILAPDFDEFCKQEDAFEFANDYDNSTAGWIVGAKDEEAESEDVYEKYVKVRQDRIDEQNRKQKEKKRRTIVAIVVPVVVVVVAVVVVVVIVVVKKRKAKRDEDGSKEQEMSNQE